MTMRWSLMAGTTALAAAVLALSPAMSAVRVALGQAKSGPVSLRALGSIGSFTPVTSDPRLARAYARAAATAGREGFRFTPASGAINGRRAITVLVRAPAVPDRTEALTSGAPLLGIAPVAYSLGSARGLQRMALSEAGKRQEIEPIVENLAQPEVRAFSIEAPRRFSANVRLDGRAPVAAPQLVATDKVYAVDVGSRYALTRNLDVRAGVRYNSPRNRLSPLTDEAQDSQAIYIGTAFKF